LNYYKISPPENLRNYVRFFWVFESEGLDEPYFYRSMADSCAELIFHYRGTFKELSGSKCPSDFYSGLHSQSQSYRRFITNENFGIFGAYIYPFAVRQLFKLSPEDLTNRMPDLQTILGKSGSELEERIMLAPDNKQRVQILTEFLESRLHTYPPDHHPALSAVIHVIHSGKQQTVEELANRFNLSERQFERKFKEYSGFSPKRYLRIRRFEEACNRYGDTVKKTLTDIAYECGYYDQSHFIHDFKSFSGYHPAAFFSGDAEGTEWREADS